MTLITYPTRVHIADGVLEEALHSELERLGSRRILLLHNSADGDSALSDRVRSGIPRGLDVQTLVFESSSDFREVARGAIDETSRYDTLVAFGSAAAIELGRKCRYRQMEVAGLRPNLFAVPAVDGLPDPCRKNIESSRAGLPTVLICDPTVVVSADRSASMAATVMSFVRCIESYLASAYNPPADGMALDGMARCLATFARLGQSTDIEVYRELMAAALNASFSQEKGIGPAQKIVAKLAEHAEANAEAQLARIVLPAVIQTRRIDDQKARVLSKVIGRSDVSLARAVAGVLPGDGPLPSLSSLGVDHAALSAAADTVAGTAGLSVSHMRQALEAIYGDA